MNIYINICDVLSAIRNLCQVDIPKTQLAHEFVNTAAHCNTLYK